MQLTYLPPWAILTFKRFLISAPCTFSAIFVYGAILPPSKVVPKIFLIVYLVKFIRFAIEYERFGSIWVG